VKTLYVNGCSWSRDTLNNLENIDIHDYKDTLYGTPFLWCNHLAKKLSCRLINEAKGSGSNDRIFRKTTDYLINNNLKDLFVILQFTWPERTEYLDNDGKYKYFSWEEDVEVHKYFLNTYSEKHFIKRSIHTIINLHKHLKSVGVDHLCFFAPAILKEIFNQEKYITYIDKNNFILDTSFRELQTDYIKEGDGHPGINSQYDMFELIYNRIKL